MEEKIIRDRGVIYERNEPKSAAEFLRNTLCIGERCRTGRA
jgi:hypothetical protein